MNRENTFNSAPIESSKKNDRPSVSPLATNSYVTPNHNAKDKIAGNKSYYLFGINWPEQTMLDAYTLDSKVYGNI